MADVLGGGPERGPRRRPRWLSVAVGVAIAAVLTVLAVTAGRPERRPAAQVPQPVLETSAPPAVAQPAPEEELTGVDGPGPRGVRLLVGGAEPGVLDLGTGRFTALHDELRMGGGARAVLGRGPGFTAAAVFFSPDEFARASLLLDRGGTVQLGAVRQVLPSRDGGVYVVSCVPGASVCGLSLRDRAGVTRWRRDSPPEVVLVADTAYGLLTITRSGDQVGSLRLQDGPSGRVLRLLGRTVQVLAVSPERIAFQELDCEPGCPVLVVRLADGTVQPVPVPAGRLLAGAFAPDGRRLALGLAGLPADDRYPIAERSGYAVVVDLATRHWEPLPGLRTGVGSTPVPLWTRDRLLLVARVHGATRFATWHPGARTLTVLPHTVPGPTPTPQDLTLL